MEDVIQVQDQFYILATASKAAERTAVLKHGDTFAVFDYSGDVGAFDRLCGETGRAREGGAERAHEHGESDESSAH